MAVAIEKPKLVFDYVQFHVTRLKGDFNKTFGAQLKALKGKSETTGRMWRPRTVWVPWSAEAKDFAVACVKALPPTDGAANTPNLSTKIVARYIQGLSVPSLNKRFEEPDISSGRWIDKLEKSMIDHVDQWWEREGREQAEKREQAVAKRDAEKAEAQRGWLTRIKQAVIKGDDAAILEVLDEARQSSIF